MKSAFSFYTFTTAVVPLNHTQQHFMKLHVGISWCCTLVLPYSFLQNKWKELLIKPLHVLPSVITVPFSPYIHYLTPRPCVLYCISIHTPKAYTPPLLGRLHSSPSPFSPTSLDAIYPQMLFTHRTIYSPCHLPLVRGTMGLAGPKPSSPVCLRRQRCTWAATVLMDSFTRVWMILHAGLVLYWYYKWTKCYNKACVGVRSDIYQAVYR